MKDNVRFQSSRGFIPLRWSSWKLLTPWQTKRKTRLDHGSGPIPQRPTPGDLLPAARSQVGNKYSNHKAVGDILGPNYNVMDGIVAYIRLLCKSKIIFSLI